MLRELLGTSHSFFDVQDLLPDPSHWPWDASASLPSRPTMAGPDPTAWPPPGWEAHEPSPCMPQSVADTQAAGLAPVLQALGLREPWELSSLLGLDYVPGLQPSPAATSSPATPALSSSPEWLAFLSAGSCVDIGDVDEARKGPDTSAPPHSIPLAETHGLSERDVLSGPWTPEGHET